VSLGFSDPIICNRYLLIGLYATLAASTYFIYIRMYIIHELYGKWSVAMDLFCHDSLLEQAIMLKYVYILTK
jgi:hypothetical protein